MDTSPLLVKDWKMLGSSSLWAVSVLYRARPAVTRGLGFSALIWRTVPIQSPFTRREGYWEPHLTCIPTQCRIEHQLGKEYCLTKCHLFNPCNLSRFNAWENKEYLVRIVIYYMKIKTFKNDSTGEITRERTANFSKYKY